jgi:hypothetical protein
MEGGGEQPRTDLKRRIYGRTKPGTLLKHHIPVRTERWDTTETGWCETDTVVHCGEVGDGEFAFAVLTDVASTWTETRAVLGKWQRFVVEALEEIRGTLPFARRGIDSDSGAEFINHHCYGWCQKHGLEFTRGRPYRKNDMPIHVDRLWQALRARAFDRRLDPLAIATTMRCARVSTQRWSASCSVPSIRESARSRRPLCSISSKADTTRIGGIQYSATSHPTTLSGA